MAEWNKNKVLPSAINGGKEFTNGDNLAVNELNAIVNNSFYGVDFVEAMTEQPDISEIGNTGTPSVSFVSNGKFKKFKFSNLRGEKGDKGDKGEPGDSGVFDSELSENSTNGVQNSVIAKKFNELQAEIASLRELVPSDIFNGEDFVLMENVKYDSHSSGGTFNGISGRNYQYCVLGSDDIGKYNPNILDFIGNKSSGNYTCILDFTSNYVDSSTGEIKDSINTVKLVDITYVNGGDPYLSIKTDDVFTAYADGTSIQNCGISIEWNTSSQRQLWFYIYFPSGKSAGSYPIDNSYTIKLRDLVM